MQIQSIVGRSGVALVTALSLIMTPGTGLVIELVAGHAQQGEAGEASDADVDLGWPRSYQTSSAGQIVVYQPQVLTWPDQKRLTALSAVSYLAAEATEAALGVITMEAETHVSLDERLVDFSDFAISESNFPTLSREQMREIVTELVEALPPAERVIALDRILENIDTSQVTARGANDVKADPPRIFWSTGSALLVILDGDPIWAPIQGLDLQFAVNTNWDLFRHTVSNTTTLYLRHDDVWLKAAALDGPWAPAGTLPDTFSNLPADDNWSAARDTLPGRAIRSADMPRVFTTTEPAELIALDGEPNYVTVEGTSLEWVTNSESDLFRMGRNGAFYYLVAGRWFSAPSLDGPWTFATPTLPEAFRQIPVEHARSRVLASVPGSDQANEAILLAQVPRTARVSRSDVEAPDVLYQGEPEFESIDPTTLERAVNTDKDVIKAGDLYYLCLQGVWFTSTNATGPWEVASSVPQEIYDIPASSPVHHVTYVTVEESNDASVTFAYVAGYTGVMIAFGAVVWGSGWHYPPYVWYGGAYPVYYRYPVTYGMGARYNPWTGAYGRGAGVYGPYGGAGWGASYNPRTGTYARGAAAHGPYNSRAAAQAWNPRTGTYAQTRQGSNVYGSWGSTSVQRGDSWAQTARVTNNVTGATTRVTATDQGAAVSRRGPGGTAVAVDGNLYAGNDGNVYRREDDGWQKREDGDWSTVDTPERSGERTGAQTPDRAGQPGAPTRSEGDRSTVGQLERDRTSRDSGQTRTRDYGSYKRGGSTRGSAGSYRSGGGARGGGGRGGGGRRR